MRDPACAVEGSIRQPLRVILDSKLRAAPDAQVFTGPGAALLVHASEDGASDVAAEHLQCGSGRSRRIIAVGEYPNCTTFRLWRKKDKASDLKS